MNGRDLHDLFERIANLLRMELRAFGLRFGLQPVQIEALAYLTQCNRYSNTPQAVGEFLGLTKGTVSQSLKVLERKGYLRKQPDKQDKRIVHLVPTSKGKKLVEDSIAAKGLGPALERANSLPVDVLAGALRSILREMQYQNQRKTFAACHTCRFHERHPAGSVCGLTQEPLTAQEAQLICREHQYPE